MNGIRGAIATVENTENDILKSTKELFNTIVENNSLDISKIVSVISLSPFETVYAAIS